MELKFGDQSKEYVKNSKLNWENILYKLIHDKFIDVLEIIKTSKLIIKIDEHMIFDLIYFTIRTKVSRLRNKDNESEFKSKVLPILYDYFLFTDALFGIIKSKFDNEKYDKKFLNHISNLYDENCNGRKYSLKNNAIMEAFQKFPMYQCIFGSPKHLLIYEAVKQYRRRRS